MTHLPTLALSIRQPWAWSIIEAGKDIENREWATRHRGPICIHASLYTNAEDDYASNAIFIKSLGVTLPPFNSQKRGGIIGVVDIVDVVTESDSPWFFGRYGFVLENARAVDFIPSSGMPGLFKWCER